MSRREDYYDRLMAALSTAYEDAAVWADAVREEVELRVGSVDFDVVIREDEYGAALDASGLIQDALTKVRRVGA
ncbi:hypothetical protein ACFWY9_29700 [Amycolatopsis sp. NPDC059027]|uniref:hypothetical protein n=1 Tax=Amycolatopsis sp. NPDC059027 TaxID=3346709 RepID=UPI00366E718C